MAKSLEKFTPCSRSLINIGEKQNLVNIGEKQDLLAASHNERFDFDKPEFKFLTDTKATLEQWLNNLLELKMRIDTKGHKLFVGGNSLRSSGWNRKFSDALKVVSSSESEAQNKP